MLLANAHLIIEFFDDEGMVEQVLVPLSLDLVVLEALGQEENAFKGKYFLACISEVVAAHLDLVFELGSILGVERSLGVKQLEKDDTNGPNVSLVRVVSFLNHLGCHIQGCSANGFVNLIQSLEFF